MAVQDELDEDLAVQVDAGPVGLVLRGADAVYEGTGATIDPPSGIGNKGTEQGASIRYSGSQIQVPSTSLEEWRKVRAMLQDSRGVRCPTKSPCRETAHDKD